MSAPKPIVIVSKKSYRRAVDRNKLKRRLRVILGKLKQNRRTPIIFVAKKGDLELSFVDLEKKVNMLLQKIK